jgi:hypothetical protein
MSSQTANIKSLSKIFKFDLDSFVKNELNQSNFLEYYSITNQVLGILIDNENRKEATRIQLIQETCDRILEYCSRSFYDDSINDCQRDKILLQYLIECSPYSSSKTLHILYKVYLFYFLQMAKTKEDVHIKVAIPDDTFISIDKSCLKQINYFNDQEINFLDSLFSIISKNSHFSDMHLNEKFIVEVLIDLSLNVLYEINEYSVVSKLCINNLSNIARSHEAFKRIVLNKCFNKIKDSDLIDKSKKRLETFIEDSNLNLLTSLAEFLLPNNKNITQLELDYLKLTEYWELIQKGLVHTNSLTRKRSLYLLKRTTDMMNLNRIELRSSYSSTFNDGKIVSLYDSSASSWNDFFLCIELMEETSVNK